jgi:lipoprotein-releasing system permease protein
MAKLCFLSIFISSFSLALVMAIMNGFEKATHEKMQGIHAQIIMRAYGEELAVPSIDKVIAAEFPDVLATSPTGLRQAIIQPETSDDVTNMIMIKAVDPERESHVTNFNTKISSGIEKENNLSSLIHGNQIIIGTTLAKNLELKIGDTVNILFTNDTQARSRKITLGETKAVVAGIFSTGIDEFDASLALCALPFFNTVFPDTGITQMNVKLKPGTHEDSLIRKLKNRLKLEVYSWKELYTPLVAALKLEKYAMFLVLALLTLVASMNIISLLFMQITQKRGDIAVLKSMGMDDGSISTIFLMMGMSISFVASMCGLLAACIASWLLETYPFISLPDAYYVSHLPARMEWHLLIIVFLVIMLISFISTWFPARRTRHINISNVLRFEA